MNAQTSYTSGASVPLTRWSGTNSYEAMRARREADRAPQREKEQPEAARTTQAIKRKPERRAATRELKPAKRTSSRSSLHVLSGGKNKARPAAPQDEAHSFEESVRSATPNTSLRDENNKVRTAARAQGSRPAAMANLAPARPSRLLTAAEKGFAAASALVGALGSAGRTVASFPVRHTKSFVVLALIAIIATMLYSPLREYYVAQRSLSSLEATHSALVEDNNQLREELAVLQTQQGIEDEARLHGYVKRGEVSVKVEDIPEGAVVSRADSAAAQEPAVESEHPWYEGFLDALFGYTPEG